jgi:CelD/BcsL family acetyltransferase involved in cellulose biosynthesis
MESERESVEIRSRLEPIAAEWDALADRLDASPWDRPDWISAWQASFGHGTPYVLALRRGDHLAGVLALESIHDALRAPTNWHTPSFGGVFADADAAATLVEVALVNTQRHLEVSFVESGSPLVKAIDGLGRRPDLRRSSRVIERSPYLSLPAAAEALEMTLPAKRRSGLRRIRRRLADLGDVSVCVSQGQDRLDELLAEGFAVERSGWKGKRGTAISSQESTLRFYAEIAHRFARRGWLRLAFLRLEGRVIAFDLAVERGGVHYLLKTGYLETLRSHAPGVALRHEMILRCIANGCTSYEFLGSDVAWKREWTETVREYLQLHLFQNTVRGGVDWLVVARALPVARRVRDRIAR